MANLAPAPVSHSTEPITARLHSIQEQVDVAEEALGALREQRYNLVIEAKDDHGLSNSAIAAATGLSHTTVWKIMGKPPR